MTPGLDADVERRDRLVEHDQLRLEREGPGDADTLALAAGELVREAPGVVGRRARRGRATPRREPRDLPGTLWICNGSAIAVPTVRRGSSDAYGSWNTICISRRSGWSSLRGIPMSSRALETHRAGGRREQLQHAPADRRLAGAALADETQRRARSIGEATLRRPPARCRWTDTDALHAADRERLDEVRAPRARNRRGGRHAHRCAVSVASASRRSPSRHEPVPRRGCTPSRGPSNGRSSGRSPAQLVGTECGHRTRNAQPDRRAQHVGRRAGDRYEPLAAQSPAGCASRPTRVGVRRGDRRSSGRCRARPARPAYMTCTRSAMRATTPRSWVMNTTAASELVLDVAGSRRGSGPAP